jgi:hypothetical protein
METPPHFWDSKANCRKYLKWLAEHLGYKQLDDWYGISREDFARTGGIMLLIKYKSQPCSVLMDLIPSSCCGKCYCYCL